MAYGVIEVLNPSSHAEIPLSGTGGGAQYPSIAILNPNDGIVYVARNRDCPSANKGAWDWKVPSQSYAALPGPFQSLGMFYTDQSGASQQGEITVYVSQQHIEIPLFSAIGRALQAQSSTLDVSETSAPASPGVGILRVWADTNGTLHAVDNAGLDRQLHVVLGVSIGTGTVNLPSVAACVNMWFYTKALGGSKTVNAPAANQMYPPGLTTQTSSYTSVNGESVDWFCDGVFWYGI